MWILVIGWFQLNFICLSVTCFSIRQTPFYLRQTAKADPKVVSPPPLPFFTLPLPLLLPLPSPSSSSSPSPSPLSLPPFLFLPVLLPLLLPSLLSHLSSISPSLCLSLSPSSPSPLPSLPPPSSPLSQPLLIPLPFLFHLSLPISFTLPLHFPFLLPFPYPPPPLPLFFPLLPSPPPLPSLYPVPLLFSLLLSLSGKSESSSPGKCGESTMSCPIFNYLKSTGTCLDKSACRYMKIILWDYSYFVFFFFWKYIGEEWVLCQYFHSKLVLLWCLLRKCRKNTDVSFLL